MHAYSSYDKGGFGINGGLGQVDTSFDFGTFLGTSELWLIGGLVLFFMMSREGRKERKKQTRAARERYESEVRRIRKSTRFGATSHTTKVVRAKHKQGDVSKSGKVWSKGAWRKPENIEGLEDL